MEHLTDFRDDLARDLFVEATTVELAGAPCNRRPERAVAEAAFKSADAFVATLRDIRRAEDALARLLG